VQEIPDFSAVFVFSKIDRYVLSIYERDSREFHMTKDYYQILGLQKNATGEQIKKAYRKLAMQFHPDRNPGKEEWANGKFKEINEAYAVLGDPEKRKQYDQFGTAGNFGDIFSSTSTRTTFEDLMKDFGGAGFGLDFLDGIFGDLFKGKGFSFKVYGGNFGPGMQFGNMSGMSLDEMLRRAQQPQAGNAHYEISISKEQAEQGMEKDLVRKGKKLLVKIPAGIKSGMNVRLPNARRITDKQPGDIIIKVKVKQ
jgi:curved DNA-binding protein